MLKLYKWIGQGRHIGMFNFFKESDTVHLDKLSDKRRQTINIITKTYLYLGDGVIDYENPVGIPENPFDGFGNINEHEVAPIDIVLLKFANTFLIGSDEEIINMLNTAEHMSETRDLFYSQTNRGEYITKTTRMGFGKSFLSQILATQSNSLGISFGELVTECILDLKIPYKITPNGVSIL